MLVYTASTHTRPHELFGGDGKRMTSVTDDFVSGRELAEVERFTAISADGTEVDAWLVRPPGFDEGKNYPTLLTIHGGPFSQYGTGFFDEVQVYAGAGYCVLFSNPRGGSGYSEEWGRAIRGPGDDDSGPGWGSVDYEDVMGVVDTALEQFPFLDAERLGVLGGSYGGYLTSWIVGHTKRFKAALSERVGQQPHRARSARATCSGSSSASSAGRCGRTSTSSCAMSPATYARDIETPLLVVHSENDLRCNIEQGEHLFTLLRLLGKETEMLRFPAEGHELSRSGSPDPPRAAVRGDPRVVRPLPRARPELMRAVATAAGAFVLGVVLVAPGHPLHLRARRRRLPQRQHSVSSSTSFTEVSTATGRARTRIRRAPATTASVRFASDIGGTRSARKRPTTKERSRSGACSLGRGRGIGGRTRGTSFSAAESPRFRASSR